MDHLHLVPISFCSACTVPVPAGRVLAKVLPNLGQVACGLATALPSLKLMDYSKHHIIRKENNVGML